jgi:hypothetical protein
MWRNGINVSLRCCLASAALIATLFMTGWAGVGVGAQAPAADAKNFFEIRVYNITAGKMDDFIKWMEEATRWQESVGMEILGQFAAPKQNKYVWIRQYPDEATRQKRFAAVYGSGGMKKFGTPTGYEGGEVFLAHAAKQSKLQYPAVPASLQHKGAGGGAAPPIYEFRIYDIKPGTGEGFANFMGDKMVPWQQRAYDVDVFAQLLPFAKVIGGSGGGKVEREERTYIWSRVFDDEKMQVEKYKMYKDPAFRSVGSPVEAGLDKPRIIILTHPTTFSKLQ